MLKLYPPTYPPTSGELRRASRPFVLGHTPDPIQHRFFTLRHVELGRLEIIVALHLLRDVLILRLLPPARDKLVSNEVPDDAAVTPPIEAGKPEAPLRRL